MYIVIAVGNARSELDQHEWYTYTKEIDEVIREATDVFMFGGPPNWWKWRSVGWIAEIKGDALETTLKGAKLISEIVAIRVRYKQDSIWIMTGDGMFV